MATQIEKSWHKANDKNAMTFEQYEKILELATPETLLGWNFPSASNAMRSITAGDASYIIRALGRGEVIEIV